MMSHLDTSPQFQSTFLTLLTNQLLCLSNNENHSKPNLASETLSIIPSYDLSIFPIQIKLTQLNFRLFASTSTTTMTKIPIWLDCDPGHDDTVAILLGVFHPDFKLVGISTTYGNASLENTTHNALSVLTTLKATNVPVYIGSSKPLEKKPSYAPDIHGESGLDGTDELLPPVISTQNQQGDLDSLNNAIWNAVQTYGEDLSIVAVGPLTNISIFFKDHPEARSIIKRLSIMGGSFDGVYNRGHSEFNIWCDPKAAKHIFDDPILAPKTVLLPLNVTHTVCCDAQIQKKILNEPNTSRIRKMIYELVTFFASSYRESQNFYKGPPVHDPLAVYALLHEYHLQDIGIEYKRLKLNCIEYGEEEGKLEYKEDENGVKVIFKIDVDQFWDTLLKVIALSDTHASIELNE